MVDESEMNMLNGWLVLLKCMGVCKYILPLLDMVAKENRRWGEAVINVFARGSRPKNNSD